MNCGFHGIPCNFRYKGLDTQELIHPKLSVDIGDLPNIKSLIRKLNEDEVFYNEMSKRHQKRFLKYYSEDSWLKHWRKEKCLITDLTKVII